MRIVRLAALLLMVPTQQGGELLRHVRVVGTIELEERRDVLNVLPVVVRDPLGGVLLVDVRESQVRRYTDSGKLLMAFGRSGGGPGEFSSMPLSIARLPDARIVVGDAEGIVSVFDSSGRFIRRARLSHSPIYSVVPVGRDIVVATQRLVGQRLFLLHHWKPEDDSLRQSFFEVPSVKYATPRIVAMTGGSSVTVRGDTLLATFSMSDTLYRFEGRTEVARKLPLPLKSFTYHEGDAPMVHPTSGIFQKWMKTGARIDRVFVADDGSLWVQYSRIGDVGPEWQWARLHRDGRRDFDVASGTQLLFIMKSNPVFVDPESLSPSVWKVGEVKVAR